MCWKSGIDVQVQPEKYEMGNIVFDEATTNHGPGKYLPRGPICIYNGKTIPCEMYVSERGGITSDILVAVLTVLDELDVFPRDSGITPFMPIDGHSSRLDLKFLTYTKNCNHQWEVFLSVLYATSLWKVGDTKEQNGTFESEWYRAKTSLYEYKGDFNLELKIKQEDVMPLLNRISEKSYGRVGSNLRALSDFGWNPPNCKLLDHPDIVGQEQ